MLHGTIRENICLGDTSISDEAMKRAAVRAHVEDFIAALPNGYDTVVGDQAVKISGGQRQRIAIARAILRQPDLYILDEPTSALDSESEAAVHSTLLDLARDKAVIVITHRIEALDSCGRVFELQRDGGVKELRPGPIQVSVSGK
jgi:ABC-type multidrug transport system fused ATPase/permease subunit